MIYKKGTEVEVLEKGELPFESWRPAKILSGNGHTYVVKYDSCSLETAVPKNKVPRKVLRPRPPLLIRNWACADFVEVFHDGSWKLAEVLRTCDLNNIVARLLNSSKEIVASFFQLRVPQTWKDNNWISLQKESVKCKDLGVNSQPKRRILCSQMPLLDVVEKKGDLVDRYSEVYDDYGDQFYQKTFRRMKKKSLVYPHAGCSGKKQKIMKNGEWYAFVAHNLSNQLFEKVDAVDSQQVEKHLNASFSRETAGYVELGMYCQKPIANGGSNHIVNLELSENESTSSVGSCSVFDCLLRPVHQKISQRQEHCAQEDDAESFCGFPTRPTHFKEGEMPEVVHRLELDAYRSILRSLYASGTLSWDQKLLLTNLRLALNISNDEYLSEINHLASTRS